VGMVGAGGVRVYNAVFPQIRLGRLDFMNRMECFAVVALLVGAGCLGGCSQELFTDRDARSDQSLRYYDNDSATATTAARKQSAASPFGMPQGSAAQ
jgi:hypothetical protein